MSPLSSPPVPTGGRPSKTEARALRLVGGLALWTAVGVTALLGFAAWRFLRPDSLGFDSDTAIPVLMSNETHWDVFHAFYFGEDRFGAWPFALLHGLGTLLHRPVTAEFLALCAALFLFAGALPAALLFRPWLGVGALAYALSLLIPEVRVNLSVAQPYSWQLPLLLWGWWCLRRSWAAQRPRTLAAWLSLATLVSGLATWTSALSGPLLLGVTVVEGLTDAAASSHPRRRWALQLLPALLAMGGEALLRRAWHTFVLEHYQRNFRSLLRLDWGHFGGNTKSVWLALQSPILLASLAVLTASVALLLVRRWKAPRGQWRLSAVESTVVGAFLLAVLQLPVLVLVRHVRVNAFSTRYFAPTYVFLVFGGLLALANWVLSRRSARAGATALLASTLALVGMALLVFPRAGRNPDYARSKETAQRLGARAPGELLLDGYWGTYLFAALAPPGALLPLPRSGDYNRIPALEERLESAGRVVVGHRGLLLGPEGSEPRWLLQYGTLLEREDPSFLSDGVDRFSTYRPRHVQDVPFVAEPSPHGLGLQAGSTGVLLSAAAALPGTALAVELSCLGLRHLPSAWGEDVQGERVPLSVEAVPGAVFVFPEDAGRALKRVHVAFGEEDCQLREARWYVRPS